MAKRWQYQIHSEPVSLQSERITPDKWDQPTAVPIRAASAFAVLAALTASAFVPVVPTAPVAPSVTSWHPAIEQPIRAQTFRAYQYFAGPETTSFAERVSVDKWYQPTERPVQRRAQPPPVDQAFVPVVTATPVVPSVDSWHPPIEQPTRRAATAAYITSGIGPDRQPIPRLDSWFAAPQLPRFDVSRRQFLYSGTEALSTAKERPSVDKWFMATEIPRSYWDRKTGAAQYSTYFSWNSITPAPPIGSPLRTLPLMGVGS